MKVLGVETVHTGYFTLQTFRVQLGNHEASREVLRAKDSVSILIYNTESRHIILVNQMRVAMVRADNPNGLIIETIAGRCDKAMTPQEIAASEALEEAGITIAPKKIIALNCGIPMAVSAGATNERAYLMYAEIQNADMDISKNTFGLASEGEETKRVLVSLDELELLPCEDVRTFALIQYLLRKLDK